MASDPTLIPVVTTVAELRAWREAKQYVGLIVCVESYATKGDACPARFYQVYSGSGADDGGVFINSTFGAYHYILQKPTEAIDARWYGVLGSGTDDTVAIQRVLNSVMTFGVANQNAEIAFPLGSRVSAMLMYGGLSVYSLVLTSPTAGGRGNSQVTWQWLGTAGTTMLCLMGANQTLLRGMMLDSAWGTTGSVQNLVHVASTTVDTHLVGAVTAGSSVVATVTAGDTANMALGMALPIGKGTANWEIVYVTAISGNTFTATFKNSHLNNERVGGPVAGSEGVEFENCAFQVGNIAKNGASVTGILWGNQQTTITPDVAAMKTKDCQFAYSGTPGDSYAGQRFITGGNVKNWSDVSSRYTSFSTPIAYEALSGHAVIFDAEFLNTTFACVSVTGGTGVLTMESCGSEDSGSLFLNAPISSEASAELINNLVEYAGGTGPLNDIVISASCSLNIRGGIYGNAGSSITLAKVVCGDLTTNTSGLRASQLIAEGAYFHGAGPGSGVFFTGATVILPDGNSVTQSYRISIKGCYGPNGAMDPYDGQTIQLGASCSITGISPGVNVNMNGGFIGRLGDTWARIIIPFATLQAGALTKDLAILAVPAASQITKAIAQVTTAFTGPAGPLNFILGTTVGGAELLASFSASSIADFGLVNADMGTALAPAALVQGGDYAFWAAGGFIRLRLTSGSGNLSGLTAGSLRLFIKTDRVLLTA